MPLHSDVCSHAVLGCKQVPPPFQIVIPGTDTVDGSVEVMRQNCHPRGDCVQGSALGGAGDDG